jgi:integrase
MKKRKVIQLQHFPEFPEVSYVLGYRNTVSKQDQDSILEEVRRISWHINPRVYLGIRFLRTYISVRPDEMRRLKEGDIDLDNGLFLFPDPKEKRLKRVPITPEDLEILNQIPRGLPELPFFRHLKGYKGCKPGQMFGKKHFYNWWTRARKNLGIKEVDLYGGTRHSSALALRVEGCTPEEIRRATMHSTNKAFERYYKIETDEIRSIYQKSQGATALQPLSNPPKKSNILKFQR